jgi:hypothetical protein
MPQSPGEYIDLGVARRIRLPFSSAGSSFVSPGDIAIGCTSRSVGTTQPTKLMLTGQGVRSTLTLSISSTDREIACNQVSASPSITISAANSVVMENGFWYIIDEGYLEYV